MSETPEEIYNKMQESIAEIARLNNAAKQYKNQIKNDNFDLDIIWENQIDQMNFENLKTEMSDEFTQNLKTDYSVINLDLDKVVENICEDAEQVFPKDNLFTKRSDSTIARLIESIESQTLLIPPILELIGPSKLAIVDGNHRIAVSRYLKIKQIPFLIKTNQLEKLSEFQ